MNKIFEKGILTGKVCLILSAIMLLTACKTKAQLIEYAIIRDVSESTVEGQTLKADELLKKIVPDLELSTTKKAVNFRTALCGRSTIPEVKLASLPGQNSVFGPSSVRTRHLRQFLAKAKTDIDYLVGHPCDQQQTNLYRAIGHVAGQFDENASSKTLIVFSDLAEVSSVFNAKKYAGNPSGLMSEYNEIIKEMEQDSVLPDLSGFTILLVTPGTTDLHLWLARFWNKLLSTKGALVQVKAVF